MVSLENDPETRCLDVARVKMGCDLDREGRLGLRLIDWVTREG